MKVHVNSALGIGLGARMSQTYQEMVASPPMRHKKQSVKAASRFGPRLSKACEDGNHSVCYKKNCTCTVCKHGYVGE